MVLLAICTACTAPNMPMARQELVIEGWVEDNARPIVMVTTTVPDDTEYRDVEDLKKHIVRWAKVTVSDGDKDVILSGRIDKQYVTSYIYTKDTFEAEEGKTYTITAEYGGRKATASVKVPSAVDLQYLKVEKVEDKDGAYRIVAGLQDPPSTVDRYKFFVRREGKDSTYMSSFLGYVDDANLSSEVEEIAVYRGYSILNEDGDQYFSADDVVYIKFCVLDDQTWKYWSDFEDIFSLSRNPFFPVTSRIRSNVTGGLGYWSGYGARYYKVSIPDSLAVEHAGMEASLR